MKSQSDAALLCAWRAKDERSGAALYRRHAASVTRFFRNKVAQADVADLTQATFLACLEHGDRYLEGASFRAFLLGFARNLLLHHYRSRFRKHDKIDFGVSSVIDLGVSPSSFAAKQQEEQRLLAALRSLAVEQQILLELYYWENMQGHELAELYGIAEGTIRSRLRRARQLLAAAYEAIDPEAATTNSAAGLDDWAAVIRERITAQTD